MRCGISRSGAPAIFSEQRKVDTSLTLALICIANYCNKPWRNCREKGSGSGTDVSLRLDFVSTNEAEYLTSQNQLEPAFIPADYISQPQTRIQAYKRLAEANSKEALQKLARNWRDQFGPHPQAVLNLLTLNEIKLIAARAKVVSIEVKDSKVMLVRGGDYLLIGDRFPRLTSGTSENNLASLLVLLSRLS